MSIAETNDTPRPARKRHARPNRRPAATAVPPAPAPSELDGLTVTDCAIACNEARCVISGIGVCMHPCKGGLHAKQLSQPDTMRRFNAAKRIIGDNKLKVAI